MATGNNERASEPYRELPWREEMGQDLPSSRRTFLLASLGVLAACALPRELWAEGCALTTPDILGPYWIPDAPTRTVLASPDEAGRRLFVSGRVLGNDCGTALEGTIVDVWQATDSGCYSVVQPCPDEDPFNLRGQMMTDPAGHYAFETVLPGYYPGRCRHIHLRIVPAAGPILVTQLYFQGDPRIPNDPFASDPDAVNRIIPLQEDENGALHGVFEMNLAVELSDEADPDELVPTRTALFGNYPNPLHGEDHHPLPDPSKRAGRSIRATPGRPPHSHARGPRKAGRLSHTRVGRSVGQR